MRGFWHRSVGIFAEIIFYEIADFFFFFQLRFRIFLYLIFKLEFSQHFARMCDWSFNRKRQNMSEKISKGIKNTSTWFSGGSMMMRSEQVDEKCLFSLLEGNLWTQWINGLNDIRLSLPKRDRKRKLCKFTRLFMTWSLRDVVYRSDMLTYASHGST